MLCILCILLLTRNYDAVFSCLLRFVIPPFSFFLPQCQFVNLPNHLNISHLTPEACFLYVFGAQCCHVVFAASVFSFAPPESFTDF